MPQTNDVVPFSGDPEALFRFLTEMQESSAPRALDQEARLRILVGPPGWSKSRPVESLRQKVSNLLK